jgi:hypothetical protein
MKTAHDSTGTSGYRTMESPKEYVPLPKMRKLEGIFLWDLLKTQKITNYQKMRAQ